METLSLLLRDYKDLVGSVASIVTIGQFLAGSFICKDIQKKGSTDGVSSNPFVGGIVIGILMLQYALMLNDTAMLIVNLAAIFLNTVYLLFYYFYSNTKQEVVKSLAVGAGIIAILIGYATIEDQSLVEYRYGFILTSLMLLLIGSPLLEVREIIKKKDASSIPFPIVFGGTFVSFLWFLYGIILMNDFMILQNMVGFTLCVIQLALCAKYPVGKATKVE